VAKSRAVAFAASHARQSCWYWFLLARLFINVRWKPDNAVTIITINTIANITSGRLKPC